jgi:hypothetical protein
MQLLRAKRPAASVKADVAQTVEQLIRNQQVSSSILLIGSSK